MKKAVGTFLMLLGMALVFGAVFLLMKNQREDQTAQEFAQFVLPEIREEIQQVTETAPDETIPDEMEPEVIEYIPVEYTPVEYLEPEDLVMTEKVIKGYAYIGYLTIPDLGLELPVMSEWNYSRLRISPCRYTGTARGEDLVIMAHNYSTHFGRLSQLSMGAQIQFMDMDGTLWEYEVVAMDVLAAESVEEMTAGEYDLTLFTCAKNRTHRVTVRCNKIAEE